MNILPLLITILVGTCLSLHPMISVTVPGLKLHRIDMKCEKDKVCIYHLHSICRTAAYMTKRGDCNETDVMKPYIFGAGYMYSSIVRLKDSNIDQCLFFYNTLDIPIEIEYRILDLTALIAAELNNRTFIPGFHTLHPNDFTMWI